MPRLSEIGSERSYTAEERQERAKAATRTLGLNRNRDRERFGPILDVQQQGLAHRNAVDVAIVLLELLDLRLRDTLRGFAAFGHELLDLAVAHDLPNAD